MEEKFREACKKYIEERIYVLYPFKVS